MHEDSLSQAALSTSSSVNPVVYPCFASIFSVAASLTTSLWTSSGSDTRQSNRLQAISISISPCRNAIAWTCGRPPPLKLSFRAIRRAAAKSCDSSGTLKFMIQGHAPTITTPVLAVCISGPKSGCISLGNDEELDPVHNPCSLVVLKYPRARRSSSSGLPVACAAPYKNTGTAHKKTNYRITVCFLLPIVTELSSL
jgi:hypothetical protein